MMNTIKNRISWSAWNWFFHCPLDDREDARKWRFLNLVLLILSILATISGIGLYFLGDRWIGEVGLFTAIVYILLFAINHRGAVHLAASAFVGFMMVAIVIASMDGSRDLLFAAIVPLMYVIPITIAGMVLSWKRILITLAVSIGAMAWLYLRGVPQLDSYRRENSNVILALTFLLIIILLAVGLFIALFNWQLARERERVRIEQEKSERLLLNILPQAIADKLKEELKPIAEKFSAVTVLFADIVDFTGITAKLSPEEVVAWLNEIFSGFDRLAESFGLEKIKTIGDSYMVVAGLPSPRADHAGVAAKMAFCMLNEMSGMLSPGGKPVRLRIGLHSGEVVAGVIGTKKFIYDLWGDTVNTASRMESHGLPGFIQVSDATHALLSEGYYFEDRGIIDIKGKGPMPVYLLTGAAMDPCEN